MLRFRVPLLREMGRSTWEIPCSSTGKGEPFASLGRQLGTAEVLAWTFVSAPPFSELLLWRVLALAPRQVNLGSPSTHLVKYSMATTRYFIWQIASGKGPNMYIPHVVRTSCSFSSWSVNNTLPEQPSGRELVPRHDSHRCLLGALPWYVYTDPHSHRWG